MEAADDDREVLAALWATPVGRRWVLKSGLGSQLAPAAQAKAKAKPKRKAPEQVQVHFRLGHARGVTHLTLHGHGQRLPLVRHTQASRRALAGEGGLWAKADLGALTHHVRDIELPGDRAMVLTVRGRHRGKEVVVAQHTHVPEATMLGLARTSRRLHGSYRPLVSPARLRPLGLKPRDITSPQHVAQLATVSDGTSTAATVVSVHPHVATVDPTASGITQSLLARVRPVVSLGEQITAMGTYQTNVPVMQDGEQVQIVVGPDPSTDSRPLAVYTFSDDPTFQQRLTSAVTAAITVTRNTASLGAVLDEPLEKTPSAATATWKQPQGVLPQSTPYTGEPQGGGIDIRVKNPGMNYGTQIVPTGT